MTSDLASAMHTAGRLAATAADHASTETRAATVLEELTQVIPIEAAEIIALNPFGEGHTMLATHGYSPGVLESLHSKAFFSIMESLDLPSTGRPVRMKDLPGDPLDNWAVADVLLPAGFSEGITMCLRTSDGRFVGVLNLSTTDVQHPSDLARDILSSLCIALGNMADPLASRGWIQSLLGSTAQAVGLDESGQALDIPGVRPHTLLEGDHELLDLVRRTARMDTWSSFVWPSENDFLQIRVLPCSSIEPVKTVVSSEPIDVGPLSRRELEVLTLAAEGLSNAEIGQALVVSPRTVGTHIEHILDKLQAPNRAAATAYALKRGLILGKVNRTSRHPSPQ
jgi:DNA-binding CsgD family transcriptional regulator